MKASVSRIHLLSAALLALGFSPGCSMMGVQELAQAPTAPTYTIEVRARGRKPKETQVVVQGNETVQSSIELVKANKLFRGLDVAVVRQSNQSHQEEILKVPYDRRKKKVDMMHDYAVLPGDRVMIVEDNTSFIDEMLDDLPAPLAGMLGSGDKP
jgi:hypothetical protein